MIVILGGIVVLAAVLTGFSMAGGHVHALIHPSELVTIGGASLGALIMMSTKKVLTDLVHSLIGVMKNSPYNDQMYRELFKLTYDLMRVQRRDGLLALENHIVNPFESPIFGKYPRFLKDHHAVEFLCSSLASLLDGGATPEQVSELLEAELKVLDEEHHAPINVLSKSADALPGFGIVAAVLGIVVTMGAIDGPVEEVGHKVGAALVGTFLGILMSYGLFAPLAARMELLGATELAFFRTIATIVLAQAKDYAPRVAIERARRGAPTEVRPKRTDMDQLFREAEAA